MSSDALEVHVNAKTSDLKSGIVVSPPRNVCEATFAAPPGVSEAMLNRTPRVWSLTDCYRVSVTATSLTESESMPHISVTFAADCDAGAS